MRIPPGRPGVDRSDVLDDMMPTMNPLRSILLRMADSPTWRRLLTGRRVTRRVVRRFIPGESLDAAVAAARGLQERGARASLNPLGEHVHSREDAAEAADVYVEVLDRIEAESLDSGISLKLTMLGLDLDPELAAGHLRTILERAREIPAFVRIDMESHPYVDPTLEIYRAMRPDFDNLGVVIQSYLRRSGDDVDELVREGASIRLVKGAYQEPPEVAFPKKAHVDANFRRLMERLAGPDARDAGTTVAVATHDERLVNDAVTLMQERDLGEAWELQMLYGIRRDLQRGLLERGLPLRVYISYGESWYPWFMRRLAERPANLWFFLRHLLS